MVAELAAVTLALEQATWGIIAAVLSIGVVVLIFMNANKKDPGINAHRRRGAGETGSDRQR